MAYDPQREDYQRLGLRFARSLDGHDATSATRAFASFGRRFAQDRDSLPQSDADRAFHLVATATRAIDYELPFSDDQHAQELVESGHRLLDEALSLDLLCFDAWRMREAALSPSFDAFLKFLDENADMIRESCEAHRDEALGAGEQDERSRLAADLAMRPYLRWVGTQAEQALICGRNREAARLGEHALEEDPRDRGDVRFTLALAYAKLEDAEALDDLERRMRRRARGVRPPNDAWMLLARLSLAFKRCDYDGARTWLETILRTYPHAAEALIRQAELPDGVFARLAVSPYSEDELILALSEGTVLLQEGVDLQGRGVLGTWLAQETTHMRPHAMLQVMAAEAAQDGQMGPGGPAGSDGSGGPAGSDGPMGPAGPGDQTGDAR